MMFLPFLMLPSPGLIFSISESGQFKKCEFKACTIFFVLDVFFFLKVEDYVSSHSIAKNTFFSEYELCLRQEPVDQV